MGCIRKLSVIVHTVATDEALEDLRTVVPHNGLGAGVACVRVVHVVLLCCVVLCCGARGRVWKGETERVRSSRKGGIGNQQKGLSEMKHGKIKNCGGLGSGNGIRKARCPPCRSRTSCSAHCTPR